MHRAIQDIWDARQASTIEKYCYSIRNFVQFCQMTKVDVVLPVGISLTAKYLIYIRNEAVSKGTIRIALVSLKWLNSFFPESDSLESPFLNKLVESSKRNIPSEKNQKLPFSKDMIKSMMELSTNPSLEELRNALIPSLSYSLVLRNDELIHISCKDLSICSKGLKFEIVSSKTDVYRKGRVLYLAKQAGKYSVYDLLCAYMNKGNLKIGENKFLFGKIVGVAEKSYIKGDSSISYSKCRDVIREKVIKIGLDPNLYGTHSSRSGAATLLAERVTPFELLITGRWADARSLNNYVEIGEERRFQISEKLFI